MTRAEAIRCLIVHSSTNGSGLCTDEQHYEAKQMAIQALEQQDTDLDGYSSRLWHNAYERGKADTEAKVLDAIKEIRDLFKQPAAYVPNYDAYGLCLSIVCKHMEVDE